MESPQHPHPHAYRSLSLNSSAGQPPVERETAQTLGLTADDPEALLTCPLDQATFFRAVAGNHVEAVAALLKRRRVDVNEFNGQGMTAIFLAVYNFEHCRSTEMARLLIDHGAKVTVKAAGGPSASASGRLCYTKQETGGGSPVSPRSPSRKVGSPGAREHAETKKVSVANKSPLLLALELKSSLYLKGWDYRHWDAILDLLASATVAQLSAQLSAQLTAGQLAVAASDKAEEGTAALPTVAEGWAAVFASGRHETVEVWAESQHVVALKLLLEKGSKRLKFELDKAAALSPGRIEIHEASFRIVRAIVGFLYTGSVDAAMMEHRGIDLLLAAHKLEVLALKKLCEDQLLPEQEKWIQLLTVAIECGSEALVLKVAKSIHQVMHIRQESRLFMKPAFALSIHPDGGPGQLSLLEKLENPMELASQ
eukprot:TRINITY_DN9383_c0_g1_i1.p1 TRINITY_DN9383_c0_g1~~TRINITY_DN9383_c0_g1_i1.p1  ORF type:complete len:425 (-),score=37.04 TRINITY_DN9383_c0_g1_i1:257-1531(-)